MRRSLFIVVAAVLLAAALASPADASRVDAWNGHHFMKHHSDVLAFPHRALEMNNQGTLVHVPSPGGLLRDVGSSGGDEFAGIITLGRDDWAAILAGNDIRGVNPTMAWGYTSMRGLGSALNSSSDYDFLTLGQSGSTAQAAPRFQLGGAFSTGPDLDLGFFLTHAQSRWTEDDRAFGATEVTTTGYENDYLAFTGSARFGLDLDLARQLELSASFSTGDTREDDVAAPDVNGDHTSFGIVGVVDTGRRALDWDTHLIAGFYNLSADATQDVPSPAPKVGLDHTGFLLEFGGSRDFTNGSRFVGSLGYKYWKDETTTGNQPGGIVSTKRTENNTGFPYCGAATEIKLTDRLTLDLGTTIGFVGEKIESSATNATDQTSSSEERDKALQSDWSLGVSWEMVRRSEINAGLSTFIRTNTLGDPGSLLGDNTGNDPIGAVELYTIW